MIRTHDAGTLRASDAGTTVTLAGWVARRRDHGGVIFVDLRDASGVVQVVFREEDAHALRNEFCVKVVGEVNARPAGNENPELATGAIEVVASELVVLSEAAPLPLPIDDTITAADDLRLKYRYLDLRRSGPAKALRLRSRANQIAREVLHAHDFNEIETPTLTRSTPEGARDFLVPVRLQPGTWYALPQSPQLFKQLLMVAGMERYYQIARCYRDEDFRADRQPEFTQLDIEMSFVTQDDVIALGEEIVSKLWSELAGYQIPLPIPRITWTDAMNRYGSDKPDLRYSVELVELTGYLRGTSFRVFAGAIDAGGYVGAVVMPGGASQTRKELDGWQDWAKARGARGLAYVVLDAETGEARGPVAKNLSAEHLAGLADAVGAKPGDAIFFAAAAERREAQELLGAARIEIAKRANLIDESAWAFCWVVDAPMFEKTDEGGWTAVHHPFTSPNEEWEPRFEEAPDQALAYAYDIVCNGNEIGGGSVRIHRADVQSRVFDLLGITPEEAADKFGFLLEAFKYGPPPHAGIALGWDRTCMLLSGNESIREVIAFPKTRGGFDPLTTAPTPITAQQRLEAGIDAKPKAAAGTPGTDGQAAPVQHSN
ncbi:putative aspartyl-tRNA synthetase [Actinoplanes missouriensis 431]|uniref:Aspartate--tRNA(Asp/Asn) ligase n=1 Tax=Actinoplanes missouriensis (strain ATCC 14538 / DSM 43046 / CBS 188.64 / JCM 3121 / NBRC 102363 / NCIMB 12654 / NRRL B-3342 / UNCC 431) TaxID=512565 RepID=I0HEM5_ACTM4|nr:aspartate--tRNA ligase [Actinoplanes missouriensis]BAL91462.1 putative aspartyl-tRNA synthetase [Actinoplanes missouriensis 431]